MKISVIIPNFNGIDILRNCLHSLVRHDRTPEQIIVVDNGSSDGSADAVRNEFPKVDLVLLKSNTGFTGANNAGLHASDGDLLVLLNNDCVVEPGWLENLYMRMEESSIAAVTSSMRNISDVGTMDSAGGEIDWMGFSRDIGKGEPAAFHGKSQYLPFPCGGAVMIRRSALSNPSRLFWDELFLYQEDLDLGLELLRTGWKIVYEPKAIVRHMHSATTGMSSHFKEYMCIRNRLLVLRKHFDTGTFTQLLPILKTWQTLWAASSLVKGRLSLTKAIIRGTADGLATDAPSFNSEFSVNRIFTEYAKKSDHFGNTKKKLYQKAEMIIRNGN